LYGLATTLVEDSGSVGKHKQKWEDQEDFSINTIE
jgi:hypothetical protein